MALPGRVPLSSVRASAPAPAQAASHKARTTQSAPRRGSGPGDQESSVADRAQLGVGVLVVDLLLGRRQEGDNLRRRSHVRHVSPMSRENPTSRSIHRSNRRRVSHWRRTPLRSLASHPVPRHLPPLGVGLGRLPQQEQVAEQHHRRWHDHPPRRHPRPRQQPGRNAQREEHDQQPPPRSQHPPVARLRHNRLRHNRLSTTGRPTGSDPTGSDTTESDPTGSSGTGRRSRGACRRRRGADPGTRVGASSTPESTEAEAEAESEAESEAEASVSAAAVAEESRRSQRGMSTHAQMTTIATYRIALLNNPPLAEPGHGHSAEKGHGTKGHGAQGRSVKKARCQRAHCQRAQSSRQACLRNAK